MSTAATPPRGGQDNPTRSNLDRGNATGSSRPATTHELVAHQKERFGGMKFGCSFFGWLTATGTAVLLTALLTAAGAAVGLGQDVTAGQASQNAQTLGLVGAIVLLVVILVAYFAGGYVAGRMARFNGLKQGLGVWLWSLIAAVVLAVLSLVAGSKFNLLANLNGFPRIPVDQGTMTTGGIIAAIVVVVAALVGALLGGVAGMRFHRRVDRSTPDNV
jgi:hypothetical protein